MTGIREFDERFEAILEGVDPKGVLREALVSTESVVSVRINGSKGDVAHIPADDPVPWCQRGRYLSARPDFTRDVAMHQGRYYVQDASSMFIWHVLRHLTDGCGPLTLLDACAAPGGKTTAAIDALPDGSLVVANELVAKRAAVLRENIVKWGYEGVVVTRADATRLGRLREVFDIIAVDAPCSGEGMMRKDSVAVEQWSQALVDECAARQRDIVDHLWAAVKPDGYLIYSTCTFNRTENEEMVRYIIDNYGAESVEIPVDDCWGIRPGVGTEASCYRFMPGYLRGEGLFMAVLRKPGSGFASQRLATLSARRKPVDKALAGRLESKELVLEEFGDTVRAFPEVWLDTLRQIERCADVLHAGVTVGDRAGKDLAPTQSLAMSRLLAAGAYPRVEVDEQTALDYLRRQAVRLPDGSPKGYVLLTWQQLPLGFVKNLGNRANNLYPKEWRILSTH